METRSKDYDAAIRFTRSKKMGEYRSIAVYRAVKMKAKSPGVYRECPVSRVRVEISSWCGLNWKRDHKNDVNNRVLCPCPLSVHHNYDDNCITMTHA